MNFNLLRAVKYCWNRVHRVGMFAIALAVAFLYASTLAAANLKATPIVADTQYAIWNLIVTPSLYWVDNDRLLFAGFRADEIQAAIKSRQIADPVTRLRKLYLWDNSKKSARLYANADRVCFADGVVSYVLRIDKAAKKQVVKEGPFGSEKEVEKPLPPEDAVRSNFTCRAHQRDDLVPPAPRFRHVVVLRGGTAYLDLGPGGGNDYHKERSSFPRNLILYLAQTGEAVKLPMTWDENFSQFDIAYSAYRGAYVVPPRMPRGSQLGVVRPWPKDQALMVYLLWADGRTQAVSIPHWPSEYLGHPRPMKKGWIFGGGKSPKTVALYVFDGSSVVKVESGFVREIAVSPDGCNAAVGINNKPYEMGTPISLKTFSFCAGSE